MPSLHDRQAPPRLRLAMAGVLVFGLAPSGALPASDASRAAPIDFDRQIRPILAEHCFACHGPDEGRRKAKLRLDRKEGTTEGSTVVVPGDADASELIVRVEADDPEMRMPPPSTGKRLSAEQVGILRRWIDRGAEWSPHWSFVPPRRPEMPPVRDPGWARNPIDRFVQARLEAEGLSPSPEADRATLLRRWSLDLTGLPPDPLDLDAFLADTSPGADERAVDRLLGSPHLGERLALEWLDASRYADTHGYHRDGGRDMTRWRDWVIAAFNADMPFDRFTLEQLAGDLLPGAGTSQRIASGFHRNHMINVETGAVPEEYLTAYVVDRVNTTGTVWLGLTLGCARCHDHKFDPISQKDYYRLYAFFNNVPENGIDGAKGNAAPLLRLPTPAQQSELDRLSASIRRAEGEEQARLRKALAELEKAIPTTMVMRERPGPRQAAVLARGQYDRPGERVAPALPSFLPSLPLGQPADRLALARWLVGPANSLTARVVVNRYWQLAFGAGIVRTAEDFGTQGEPPSHPELLDWLATDFVEGGWNVKRLLRQIVTSATYRQSSRATPERARRDPDNRLLSRGPRLRLPAELVRDQALAVAGLLDRRLGGASVFPYQPPGLWEELCSRLDGANFSAQSYTPSHGADLYRRSMYTFWKRTSPPPGLAAFDAPDRETCTVRRARTNTPLQALVLLNDPTYVEAARKLAERIMAEADSPERRIDLAFRLATSRRPNVEERAVLEAVYEAQLADVRRCGTEARALLQVGESPPDARLDPDELAAWSIVASLILNLDETITKG